MKITIYETRKIKKEIDIEFPYYFSYEIDSCNIEYFGKIINENECFKIVEITDDFGNPKSFTLEINKPEDSYYRFEDKSCEYVFEEAKKRMLKIIQNI